MNSIELYGKKITQNKDGLYKLNDVWASKDLGEKDKPKLYLQNSKSKDFIEQQNLKVGFPTIEIKTGRYGGTYASKSVMIDYAMWISPEFKDYVISVFEDHIEQRVAKTTSAAVSVISSSVSEMTAVLNKASVEMDELNDCGKAWGKAGSMLAKTKKAVRAELEEVKDKIQLKLDLL